MGERTRTASPGIDLQDRLWRIDGRGARADLLRLRTRVKRLCCRANSSRTLKFGCNLFLNGNNYPCEIEILLLGPSPTAARKEVLPDPTHSFPLASAGLCTTGLAL